MENKIGYNIVELMMHKTSKTYEDAKIYVQQLEKEIEQDGGWQNVLRDWLLTKKDKK